MISKCRRRDKTRMTARFFDGTMRTDSVVDKYERGTDARRIAVSFFCLSCVQKVDAGLENISWLFCHMGFFLKAEDPTRSGIVLVARIWALRRNCSWNSLRDDFVGVIISFAVIPLSVSGRVGGALLSLACSPAAFLLARAFLYPTGDIKDVLN